MSTFGSPKSGPPTGPERALGYLVEVQRLGAPLRIEDAQGREVPVTLDLLSERRATLSFIEALELNLGAETHLVFILDGLRFKAPTKVLDVGTGSATVELPRTVILAERRKVSRATMSAREGVAAMAMAGLFSPLAASTPVATEPTQVLMEETGDHVVLADETASVRLPGSGLIEVLDSAPSLALRARMPWTSKDVASDATFWTTRVVDWLKVRSITLNGRATALALDPPVKSPSGAALVYANHESLLHFTAHNPFLGSSPAVRKLSGGLSSHGITYTFHSQSLPESWRRASKLSSVKLEAFCSGASIHLGLRIK